TPVATPDPNNEFDKCDYGRHLSPRCVGEAVDPQLIIRLLVLHRLCPRINCPVISPPSCARATTFLYKGGLICPGCDKSICKPNRGYTG
ncbi:uncharacterized protein LOC144625778, partial [Crassostrea virginica]